AAADGRAASTRSVIVPGSMAIIRSPEAVQDLARIVDFLARQDADLADRFLDQAEETFHEIAERPSLGSTFESTNPKLDGLKVWPIKKFPNHLIFFRVVRERVQIVRIAHGAMDLDHLD